jgi:hypothetical protein
MRRADEVDERIRGNTARAKVSAASASPNTASAPAGTYRALSGRDNARTRWPRRSKAGIKARPMYPVAPVTKTTRPATILRFFPRFFPALAANSARPIRLLAVLKTTTTFSTRKSSIFAAVASAARMRRMLLSCSTPG